MYSTILVGTDGSGPAREAVTIVGELAGRYEVDQIHVVTGYHPISSGEIQHLVQEVPEEFREVLTGNGTGTNTVDEAKHKLQALQLDVVGHAVPASGAEAILEVAENIDADLVVVGSRDHGVGRRFRRGSVSTKVAHHAECDVLIVHIPHEDES